MYISIIDIMFIVTVNLTTTDTIHLYPIVIAIVINIRRITFDQKSINSTIFFTYFYIYVCMGE